MKDSTQLILFAIAMAVFAYLFLKLAEENEIEGWVTFDPLRINLKTTPKRFLEANSPCVIEGN